jgi:hypothetical protein
MSAHASKRDADLRSGLKTVFHHFRNPHARRMLRRSVNFKTCVMIYALKWLSGLTAAGEEEVHFELEKEV